jgi:hypothetical protein
MFLRSVVGNDNAFDKFVKELSKIIRMTNISFRNGRVASGLSRRHDRIRRQAAAAEPLPWLVIALAADVSAGLDA